MIKNGGKQVPVSDQFAHTSQEGRQKERQRNKSELFIEKRNAIKSRHVFRVGFLRHGKILLFRELGKRLWR